MKGVLGKFIIGSIVFLVLILLASAYCFFSVWQEAELMKAKDQELRSQMKKQAYAVLNACAYMVGREQGNDPCVIKLKELSVAMNKSHSLQQSADIWLEMQKNVSVFTIRFDNDPVLSKDDKFSKRRNELVFLTNNFEFIIQEYNAAANSFNKTIKPFPFNLCAKALKLKPVDVFTPKNALNW